MYNWACYHQISIQSPVQYVLTGKFQAPSQNWQHLKRTLLDYELIIVTEGHLYLTLQNIQYRIKKGEYILCPPNILQFGNQAAYTSFYFLHFKIEQPPLYFPQIQLCEKTITLPAGIVGTLPSLDRLIIMMKQLQDVVRTYNNPDYSNYLTTAILIEFFHEIQETTLEPVNKEKKKHKVQLYNDIVDYIKCNISTNIKVSDIASHFGYNPKYFSSLFNSITGKSLKQYLISEKMEHAKFLLSDSNQSILEISKSLGFNDSHNFMKLFKKQVGLTPTEYRNAHSKRLLFYQ